MKILNLLAATAAIGAIAVPAAAQSTYPYQSYPVQQGYPQPGYPVQQGYPGYQQGGTNVVGDIINQLLGNRYNVSDRTQVSRCASAALAKAETQYRRGYNGYGHRQPYGYNSAYGTNGYNNGYSQMRVTAITEVQRRSNNGLRVQGLISSGAYAQPYGHAYGYQGQQRYSDPRYAQTGDLSFRCNVDYRGAVTGVRVNRTNTAYRR
jgi:hypothetical protein